MMIKKKSRSYNQEELKNICDMLCSNIEELLESLDISDYRMCDKMVLTSCPIHGGDNNAALNLYHSGDYYRGNWTCHTQHCEQVFKGSIIGFVRGCLSHKKYDWQKSGDNTVSFNDTIKFIKEFLNYKDNDKTLYDIKKNQEKTMFARAINGIVNNEQHNNTQILREKAIKFLDIPSKYFLSRGFSEEILKKYDVGECHNNKKEMHDRAVVPVYDDAGKCLIGCTGRSIYEICKLCGSYHNPNNQCPDDYKKYRYSKWKHSKNFKTENCLYNIWYAKTYIQESFTVIIVESPGNVWSLENNGIRNSVAIFGSNISHKQKAIIDMTGAMNIITIMDNDEAGRLAAEKINSKFFKTHNISNITLPDKYNDLAEMSKEDISRYILPEIRKVFA